MNAVCRHYPEYLMEAVGLGIFMVSASVATAILEHSASVIHQAIADPLLRRCLITAPLVGM
jgi:aquaporin Z